MLTVITVFFEGSWNVPACSRGVFTPEWVDRLARGVKRHLDEPHRFVCLTEEPQSSFAEDVEAVRFVWNCRDWMCINEIFRSDLGIERGLFLGLDTIVIGSLGDLASYEGKFGLTRCPRRKKLLNNALALWNGSEVHALWDLYHQRPRHVREISLRPEVGPRFASEMVYWRDNFGGPIDVVTDLFPGQVVSFHTEYRFKRCTLKDDYKAPLDLGNVRLVYFHGNLKPHQLPEEHHLKIAWRQS